jgi:DNA polymerase-3 subunit epsilon
MTLLLLLIIGIAIWYLVSSKKSTEQSYTGNLTNSGQNTKTEIIVTGPHPEKTTDFKFYKFVQYKSAFLLEPWYNECKRLGYKFKEEYENAINEKLKTGNFKNPINFNEYYKNSFDYIAIDFETANNERISACKIGLAFVHNDIIVNDDYYYIKPPKHIKFAYTHTQIHEITQKDVDDEDNFKEVWDYWLKTYFNNNLIVLHNSSMDASILKQLFEFYKISEFNINYVDTMEIAKKNGYPAKLIDLANLFGHTVKNHHDPVEDAIACAIVASNFIEKGINLKDYKKSISDIQINSEKPQRTKNNHDFESFSDKKISSETLIQNLDVEDTDNYFYNKKVVITGSFLMERQEIAELLQSKGADVNTSISKKTNIVIVGENPGPSKMEKIETLQEQGFDIEIMDEDEFLSKID